MNTCDNHKLINMETTCTDCFYIQYLISDHTNSEDITKKRKNIYFFYWSDWRTPVFSIQSCNIVWSYRVFTEQFKYLVTYDFLLTMLCICWIHIQYILDRFLNRYAKWCDSDRICYRYSFFLIKLSILFSFFLISNCN